MRMPPVAWRARRFLMKQLSKENRDKLREFQVNKELTHEEAFVLVRMSIPYLSKKGRKRILDKLKKIKRYRLLAIHESNFSLCFQNGRYEGPNDE
jgi:DNA polymerase III delta prime subunit